MKAKNRKPPDARIYARVEAMPAVGCSCIFDKRYFRSLPHYCEGRAKLKRGRVYSRKRIEVSDKNKSLNHQKQSVAKRLSIFALIG